MYKEEKINDLPFTELISIRNYWKSRYDECIDKSGICRIDSLNKAPTFKDEFTRLDNFITAKYERIKTNSEKK